jgi:uncharacterized protein YjeT (DUF2065 family)
MNFKRILGIVVLIAGFVLLGFSYYIKGQVAEGRKKISSAQQKVDFGKKVLSLNPTSEKVGKVMTDPAQKKINAGTEEADRYERMAGNLQIGGIVLVVAGIVVILLGRKRKA